MKLYRRYLKGIFLALMLLVSGGVMAQEETDSALAQMDSVDISLLTCSPGQEIWSLYGHTAIRFNDKLHQTDLAINYGLFSFGEKNFIIHFVFGKTDYQMGICPFSMFLMDYAKQGRGVVQQTLNLTREEKMAITQAIALNYQPANRIYRYNFFYDNCTTRARDIIVNHLNGKVEYKVDPNVRPTYRQMVHQWNSYHRWMSFGCDLLLGYGSDRATDYAQQQFLPDSLRADFDNAMVVDLAGHKRKLVSSKEEVLKVNEANVDSSKSIWNLITPTIFFAILLFVTAVIFVIELKRLKTFWLYDVILLTLDALAGLVLFLMIFSEHPTVKVNFQILLLNPLSLIFVYFVGNSAIRQKYHFYWTMLAVCIILFFIAGIFLQDYAEGMYLLACTLLLRCISNYLIYGKRKKCDI